MEEDVDGQRQMNRAEFLTRLRRALSGLATVEIDDIVADYEAHFDEGVAAGRTEADVARSLGDPERLARELRTEARLRRWETQRTPAALWAAIAALGGMLAIDIMILLPVLCVIGAMLIVVWIVLFALGVAGFGMLLSGLLPWGHAGFVSVLHRLLMGLGLLGGSVGVAAVLWLMIESCVRLLGRYARLHYQVLRPMREAT